ncbi:MAG TPA: DUF1844 domain-containing protein [Acidimicrobiales bacterium]|nr:DUF1844 domain-containing protein [Acidimicrobiales bacterium]
MGSLWTPGGEHPVEPDDPDVGEPELTDEQMAARMQELQRQLAATPAEVVVANHGYGLFELAALHLGQQPAQLDQARLAIDALAALVEGLPGRLGEHEPALRDGLAQLRLAFVQVRAAAEQAAPPPSQ